MSASIAAPVMSRAHSSSAQTFRCVVCARADDAAELVWRAKGEPDSFGLYRCSGCGLVQRFPRAAARSDGRSEVDRELLSQREEHHWSQAVQQYVLHLLPMETTPGRRLLDVGCALGHLAVLAKGRGWRVTGLDASPETVSEASVRFGLDVRGGTLARHRGTLGLYDVVLLRNCLEYVHDPLRLLGEVRNVLVPEGTLCVETPNWANRGGMDNSRLNFFDDEALHHLLDATGYADMRIGGYTHYRQECWAGRAWLSAVVRFLPSFLATRLNRLLEKFPKHSPWARLRRDPPATLENALRVVNELSGGRMTIAGNSSAQDHLFASASRS